MNQGFCFTFSKHSLDLKLIKKEDGQKDYVRQNR